MIGKHSERFRGGKHLVGADPERPLCKAHQLLDVLPADLGRVNERQTVLFDRNPLFARKRLRPLFDNGTQIVKETFADALGRILRHAKGQIVFYHFSEIG